MTDLATLGIRVDSTQVQTGVSELNRLTAAGAKAEGAVDRLGDSASQTGAQLKGASAQAAQYAANAQRMARNATVTGSAITQMGSASGLAAHHMQNLTFQANDIAMGLATGQRPMQVFIQQGAQIGQIMQQSGLGLRGFARELLRMTGIIKVTQDATLAADAAAAAGAANAIKSTVARSSATIAAADTELALAVASVRTAKGSEALAVAQARLAAAHEGVAIAASQAAIAEDALGVAQGRAAAAEKAAAATRVTSIGRVGFALGAAGLAAGVAFGAFKLFQSQVEKSGELDEYARSLGLTKKEMKELENVTVTAGDVFEGLWRTIAERTGVDESIADFKTFMVDQFVQALEGAGSAMAGIYGETVGTFRAISVIWNELPAMFGGVFSKAVNAAIALLESLINKSVAGINRLAAGANDLLGFEAFGRIAEQSLGRVKETTQTTFTDIRGIIRGNVESATAEAQAAMQGLGADIRSNIIGAGRDRIGAQAAEIIDDRSGRGGGADKAKKTALSEAEKAYRAALKAAQDYLAGLRQETDQIGQSVINLKRMDVAQAAATARTAAAIAPTLAQRDALLAEAAAIEAAGMTWERVYKNDQVQQFIKDRIETLEFETRLIGLSAGQQSILRAERELTDAGIERGTEAWHRYIEAVEAATAAENRFLDAERLIQDMDLLADHAAATAGIMRDAFGGVGDVFGGLIADIADYRAEREALTLEVVKGNITQGQAEQRLATIEMRTTAAAISGVKNLFKEKSAAFKAMQAIEMAYAVFQAVQTVRSIAMDSAKTASSVANSGARAAADGVAAVAKAIASLPFPLNLAAGAATAAALVSFGVKMFGGGGGGSSVSAPTSAEDLQASAGTGTVLGDAEAKSESIARSLEIVAENTNRDLQFSNDMLRALRSIDDSIAKMAGTVARQIQVSGSLFDTSRLNLGQSGSAGFLGMFATSKTRNLFDLGVNIGSASVASIIENGISGSTFQTVEQIKKSSGFLGIGGGTKTSYQTTTGALPAEISSAIGAVVRSLRDGLLTAADIIGLEGAQAILDSFTVSIGKISFKDMTGEQIEEQLNAIFSSVGDQMAGRLLPSLASLQLVGEGLFETFIRVAKEYEAVDIALRSIGRSFGQVGIESVAARSALVGLFGGLEDFLERTEFFADQFLSKAQRIAPIQSAVVAELQRLGFAGIETRDQFAATVLALDLTTASGREAYAALLNMAPAFDKVVDYFDEINDKSRSALEKTVERFDAFAQSLKKYRDTLFVTEQGQGNAIRVLRERFNATAALAATGDATALGGLESAGKSLIDAARDNASTRQDFMRDVALVARGVDAGIFAAEETADYAQLQLDALTNATSILQQISDNTAILAAPVAQQRPPDAHIAPDNGQIIAQNEQLIAQNGQLLEQVTQMHRLWQRFEGDGLTVKTDADTPLAVAN